MTRNREAAGFESFARALTTQGLPPVDKWRPLEARDMDLVIEASGAWYYQGTPFARHDLVALLSKVLVREGDEYFLVSPAEKLRITVEDAPFVVTDFEVAGNGDEQTIIFDTNVDFKVPLDADHPLTMRARAGEETPYLLVRDNLEARLPRSVFYRLVDLGEERTVDGRRQFGVSSGGAFLALAPVTWS